MNRVRLDQGQDKVSCGMRQLSIPDLFVLHAQSLTYQQHSTSFGKFGLHFRTSGCLGVSVDRTESRQAHHLSNDACVCVICNGLRLSKIEKASSIIKHHQASSSIIKNHQESSRIIKLNIEVHQSTQPIFTRRCWHLLLSFPDICNAQGQVERAVTSGNCATS